MIDPHTKTMAQEMYRQLPSTLKDFNFPIEQSKIPLPQYDSTGLFKSYLQPRNGFKSLVSHSGSTTMASTAQVTSKHKTFKDFEHLQLLNQTKYKDPVLETFLEKAKEVEQIAGSPPKLTNPKQSEPK
jgi:hypothetical protein